MTTGARYRVEDGRSWIDIRVAQSRQLFDGAFREILREGFVITGWVAMWRPLDVLLYDWWPLVDERRQIARLLDALVSIRYEVGRAQREG
jgi:hypothetical protein